MASEPQRLEPNVVAETATPPMSDPVTRLNAALEGRYRIESELGEGGIARFPFEGGVR